MSRKLVVHISRTVYGVFHRDVGVMGGSYTVPCRAQESPWPLPGLKSPRRELHAWGPTRTGAEATHTSYIVLPTSEFWPQNPHFRKSSMVVYAVVPTLRMQRQLKPWHFPEETAELNQQVSGQWGDSPRPRRRWQFLRNGTSSCPLATTLTHMFTCFTCTHRHTGMYRERSWFFSDSSFSWSWACCWTFPFHLVGARFSELTNCWINYYYFNLVFWFLFVYGLVIWYRISLEPTLTLTLPRSPPHPACFSFSTFRNDHHGNIAYYYCRPSLK